MPPHTFYQKLRSLLQKTLPPLTLAGAALLTSCQVSVHLNQESLPDASMVERNHEPQPPDKRALKDFPITPSMDRCPNEGLGDLFKPYLTDGVYRRYLQAEEPSPLSFEECSRLCQKDLSVVCKPHEVVNLEYHCHQLTTKSCEEVFLEEEKRGLECNYQISSTHCGSIGRRPHGLQAPSTPSTSTDEVGAYFATVAYLEESAVVAFSYLLQELEAYNAPSSLIEMAREGIREEVEHTALMKQLMLLYGGTALPVEVSPFQLRSPVEIACENALEGCKRETFGALMAMWQSLHAQDEAVRAVMERIAVEESRHAELSWAIDRWIRPKLSLAEKEQLDQSHLSAGKEIIRELQEEPSPLLKKYAGLPSTSQAQLLFEQLQSISFDGSSVSLSI